MARGSCVLTHESNLPVRLLDRVSKQIRIGYSGSACRALCRTKILTAMRLPIGGMRVEKRLDHFVGLPFSEILVGQLLHRGDEGLDRRRVLPGIAVVLGFVLMPALNAISRHHERQADRYAWENTPAIEPFITSMQKLADQNLAERQPNKVIEALFHSHPSIGKRIAAAESWASKQPQAQTV